jgi:non-structural maintenance of chromosomes element 4
LRDSGDGLTTTVREATRIYQSVKQTNDATLDSRLLVNVSDLANKKTSQLVLGDSANGVDVDEFLSKCITFMRNGGPLEADEEEGIAATRRRTQRTRDGDDEEEEGEEDEDDFGAQPLDFDILGRLACFPHNSRPCVPSFLLGPLSVEKRQRTQTQRRARQSKDAGRETRPQALSRDDLAQTDENHLTAICTRIRKQLIEHIEGAEAKLVENGITEMEELQSPRGKALLREFRITDSGGVSLFDYVLNPKSFGQTVENLFYISFLIKEGRVGISPDSQGLPTLTLADPSTLEEQRKNKSSKHQAVLALDYKTWRDLVKAFDVQNPLIPHRQEESPEQMGGRGWYA